MRHRSYAALDDAPLDQGDVIWTGVLLNAEPGQVPPGLLCDGENLRCRTGRPVTRKGVWKPAWMNRLSDERTLPWSSVLGKPCPFRDPNGIEMTVLAADEGTFALRPFNTPLAVSLPAGIKLWTEVSFVQAFNVLFMLRGEKMAPLVMENLNSGFEDLIDRWDVSRPYDPGSNVAWGPWQTGTVAVSGSLFLVTTPTPHGLITGSDIQVRKTISGTQDGRYTIQVLDEFQFSFQPGALSPTPADLEFSTNFDYWKVKTPEPLAAVEPIPAGEEPGVSDKWVRDWLIMPNATNGIFVNNRLLVTTSWLPGAQFDSGGYGAKRDFVAASYVLDYTHFSPKNEFRINQGSDDELASLVKIGDSSVVCLKTRSVGLLSNVTGDLMPDLRLEMIIRNYGVAGNLTSTEVGRDVVFVSPRRGVVSLQQTSTNQLQGVEKAFSDPIQPWIDKIQWSTGDKIRCAYWDDKLYVAVPLNGEVVRSGNWLANVRYRARLVLSQTPYVHGGDSYQWKAPADGKEYLRVNGESYHEDVEFVWDGGSPFEVYRPVEPPANSAPEPSNSQLYRVIGSARWNNAVLVFDYQTGQWQPMDRGADLAIKEFFVMNIEGVERLCCVTEDNYLGIYEESESGDHVTDPGGWNGLGHAPIQVKALTRGYSGQNVGFKAGQFARLVLATQAPSYSVRTRTEGVSEEATLVEERTRDRRTYERPIGAKRWQTDNVNNDFETPYRQDYSVVLDIKPNPLSLSTGEDLDLSFGDWTALSPIDVPFDLWDGVPLDLAQEANHSLRMVRLRGRWHQALIENSQGICELRAVNLELQNSERSQGVKV